MIKATFKAKDLYIEITTNKVSILANVFEGITAEIEEEGRTTPIEIIINDLVFNWLYSAMHSAFITENETYNSHYDIEQHFVYILDKYFY